LTATANEVGGSSSTAAQYEPLGRRRLAGKRRNERSNAVSNAKVPKYPTANTATTVVVAVVVVVVVVRRLLFFSMEEVVGTTMEV